MGLWSSLLTSPSFLSLSLSIRTRGLLLMLSLVRSSTEVSVESPGGTSTLFSRLSVSLRFAKLIEKLIWKQGCWLFFILQQAWGCRLSHLQLGQRTGGFLFSQRSGNQNGNQSSDEKLPPLGTRKLCPVIRRFAGTAGKLFSREKK